MNPQGTSSIFPPWLSLAAIALLAATLAGCGSSPARAPVSDKTVQEPKKPPAKPAKAPESDLRPKLYTVKKGDTLYSIALDHGLDYRDLVQWNSLDNPNRIRIGQQLRLNSPQEVPAAAPVTAPGAVEVRPLGAAEAPKVEPLKPEGTRPAEAPKQGEAQKSPEPPKALEPPKPPEPVKAEVPRPEGLKTEPKAVILPYSERNLALLQSKAVTPAKTEPAAKAEPAAKEEPAPQKPAKAEPKPEEPADEEGVEWIWPTQGKVISGFSDSSKGVDIAGKQGQPVLASAGGKVVYSGSGLRGYGKLIIIKHNKTYLSAYAHNEQVLVKEGQTVTKGQKIAEMGSSDADRVKLHFEIRRFGKPVDPLKYLPETS
jgi:lipoprotein NlpD